METLKGRKRFLSKIKFGSSTEKSKAQRQAVNSICQVSHSFSLFQIRICFLLSYRTISIHVYVVSFPSPSQGSAADIIKIAMIKIYSVIVTGVDSLDSSSSVASKFHTLRDRCRILLQVNLRI